jgi:hypothetical protein
VHGEGEDGTRKAHANLRAGHEEPTAPTSVTALHLTSDSGEPVYARPDDSVHYWLGRLGKSRQALASGLLEAS